MGRPKCRYRPRVSTLVETPCNAKRCQTHKELAVVCEFPDHRSDQDIVGLPRECRVIASPRLSALAENSTELVRRTSYQPHMAWILKELDGQAKVSIPA